MKISPSKAMNRTSTSRQGGGVTGQAILPLQKAANISVVLVAAVADNGVIGKGGGLPWRLKSDLTHFRMTTVRKPAVMGRKTHISIEKPLKDRTNIVATLDSSFAVPG